MAESKIHGNTDSGWQTLVSGVRYRKKNGIVYVYVEGYTSSTGVGTIVVGTLPVGFRPNFNAQGYAKRGNALTSFWITGAGIVNFYSSVQSGNIEGFAIFPADA